MAQEPMLVLCGNQYCAALTGVPTVQGSYRVDISVNGWVTVLGFHLVRAGLWSFVIDLESPMHR